MKLKKIARPFEIKAIAEDGSFSGYGAVFGNVDSWGDIIAPGAFAKSLAAHAAKGRMPALLWQHDSDHPIGVWVSMREDAKGLYVEGKLLIADVAKAQEAHALLKAGAISGMSIGFVSTVTEWDDNKDIRTLKEIDLWEVSLVTFPANDEARVVDVKGVENLSTARELERYLREEGGLSGSCAKAFMAKARAAYQREAGEHKDMARIADMIRTNTNILNP
jgi:uncharacterized protein